MHFKGVADGKVFISSEFHLDAHLFSLLVPIIFAFGVFIIRKHLVNTPKQFKMIIQYLSGVGFISVFGVQLYDFVLENTNIVHSNNVELISIFYNFDTLLSFAIGVSLLADRVGLVRMLSPFAIITGFANLINNPGAHLTFTNIIDNIMLCTLTLLIFTFKHKWSSLKELALSLFITTSLLTYVAVINYVSNNDFSLLNVKLLAKNKVYENIQNGTVKILLFIFFSLGAQVLTWIAINTLFLSHKPLTLLKQVRSEIQHDKKFCLSTKENFSTLIHEVDAFALEEQEQFYENEFDLETVAKTNSDNDYSEFVFNYSSVTLAKVNGPRSPSL